MSRPGLGVGHVETLEGTELARRRLRRVLETLSGESSVEEACQDLGISAARFAEIRKEALGAALGALEPRAAGRPAAAAPEPELGRAEEEIRRLQRELEVARIREEIALTMPHLLRPPAGGKKKGDRAKRDGRRGT